MSGVRRRSHLERSPQLGVCAPEATKPDRPAWAELPLGDGVPWCCDSRWAWEHGPGRRRRGRSRASTDVGQCGTVVDALALPLVSSCGSLLWSSVGRKGGHSIGARICVAGNAFASEGLGGVVDAWLVLRPDICSTHRWTQSSCATRSMLRRTTRYVAEPSSRGAYSCGRARPDLQTHKSMLGRSTCGCTVCVCSRGGWRIDTHGVVTHGHSLESRAGGFSRPCSWRAPVLLSA